MNGGSDMSAALINAVIVPCLILLLFTSLGQNLSTRIPSLTRASRRVVVALALAATYTLVWVGIEFHAVPLVVLAIASLSGIGVAFASLARVQDAYFRRAVDRAAERQAAGEHTEWYRWVAVGLLLALLAAILAVIIMLAGRPPVEPQSIAPLSSVGRLGLARPAWIGVQSPPLRVSCSSR